MRFDPCPGGTIGRVGAEEGETNRGEIFCTGKRELLFGGVLEGAGPLESTTSDVCDDDEEDPEDSPSDVVSLSDSDSESIPELSSELSEELLDSALLSRPGGFIVGRGEAPGALSSSESEPDEEVKSELESDQAGI